MHRNVCVHIWVESAYKKKGILWTDLAWDKVPPYFLRLSSSVHLNKNFIVKERIFIVQMVVL
jgi:hypothetical protein